MKVLIIGGRGALGRRIAKTLAADSGLELVLAGRDADAARATAEPLGATFARLDVADSGSWSSVLDGVGVVVDASAFAGRDHALVRASLDAGAHWLDLSANRAWVGGIGELDDLARERERVALAGAGFFCAGLDALARAAAAPMVRTNEVLVGIAPGGRGRYGPATAAEWLGAHRGPVRMLIGGEWTEREFFGDARFFEHPEPLGAQRSFNLDCADLELFTERPVRASSVRVSLSFQGTLRNRVAERIFRGAARPDPLASARRWATWGGSPDVAGVTMVARGLNDKRLPVEARVSIQGSNPEPVVETAPAVALVRQLAAGEGPEPGAGPCVGAVDEAAFLAALEGHGLTVQRGDLGGWRG